MNVINVITDSSTMIIFWGLFLGLIIWLFNQSVYQVSQAEIIIIERFGTFHRILGSGIHCVLPFIDQPRISRWTFIKEDPNTRRFFRYVKEVYRIDLRETVDDFPKQNVITKDNVTMEISALLFYQVSDPYKAVYEINNLPQAIEKLAQTMLRDVIGSMDLDESLMSREIINAKLKIRLDEAADKWGVKISRVELQEINPPADIKIAMEKQMKAERDRRSQILEAEGHKASNILEAEGYQLSLIARAEGEAVSKLRLAQAESESLEIIKKTLSPSELVNYTVAMAYIKTLPEIMKDKEGKTILVPYEATAFSGMLASLKEIFTKA